MVAHPDDVDFYCGGAVLLMTRRGVAVDLVIATSGDKGTEDPDLTGEQLAATREAEQTASAAALGAGRVAFLRRRDAELTESLDLRAELVREIRLSRPDLLLTFSPLPGHRQHPDHRVVGRVALDAAWPCARDRLTNPEAGPPHKTAEAWLFGTPEFGPRPDLAVDVSEVIEAKIEARLCHRSQTGSPASLRARWRRIARSERFVRVDLR